MKVSTGGQLHFSSQNIFSKNLTSLLRHVADVSSLNSLTMIDAKGLVQSLYFGSDENDVLSKTSFEVPPSPPAGIFDVRFSSQRYAEVYSPSVEKPQYYPLTINSAVYPITIQWNIRQDRDEVYDLSLQSGGTVLKEIRLSGSGSTKIQESDISKAVLTIRAKNVVPGEFGLQQNYPNPFNPVTEIHYSLPTASKVTLKVFNTLGQTVATIVDGVQEAGFKTVEFDASELSSGLYFYSMTAAGNDQSQSYHNVKKMLLIK